MGLVLYSECDGLLHDCISLSIIVDSMCQPEKRDQQLFGNMNVSFLYSTHKRILNSASFHSPEHCHRLCVTKKKSGVSDYLEILMYACYTLYAK